MSCRLVKAQDLEALALAAVQAGGRLAFVAHGHCMRPAIEDGDKVEVGPAAPAGWRLGDVALAHGREGLVLHRIVGLGEGPEGAWAELAADVTREPKERMPLERLIAKLLSPQAPSRPAPRRWRRLAAALVQQIRGSNSPSA